MVDVPQSLPAALARSWSFFAVLARDGTLLEVNRAGADALVDPDALGRPLWQADGWHAPALEAAVRRAAAGESVRCELEVLRRDGASRWLELTVMPLTDDGDGRLLAEGHDVTAWKLREQLARQANAQCRAVIDTQTEVVSRFRPDGTLVFVNDAWCAFVGRPRDALIGRTWRIVAHPDDVAHVEREVARMTPEAPIVTIENRVFDGASRLRWFEFVNRGFFDPRGELVEVQSIGRDITLRKAGEAERQEAARRLQAGQKLQSLGALAGGVARDISSVVASVMLHAALLRTEFPRGSAAVGCLDEIEAAAGRASRLCRTMLAYAGKGKVTPRRVDLNAVVGASLALLRAALPGVPLALELAPDLPPIDGDPADLQQIVMNLALNAGEAVRERGGQITIRTLGARVDPAARLRYFLGCELDADEFAALVVQDDGSGMTREVLARVFEPFFSTRASGRGLGLAATLGLVRAHRGAIRIDSEPGRGTCVEVVLPRALPSAWSVLRGPALARPSVGPVLVVDDDDAVRHGLAGVLETLGHAALEARGGAEALALLRTWNAPIGCLLIDLAMPGMPGDELLRRIHALRPAIPAILMTTGHPGESAARLHGLALVGQLQKPFLPHELQALLARIPGPAS